MHENKVQSPRHGYETLCDPPAPEVSYPTSPPFLGTYYPTHPLTRPFHLQLAWLMVNSYLSFKIQIRHHLCREAWATPLCVSTAPSSVHSSDRTVTTLLGHTETLGAGTLSHLSLPPYYLAQCLAHNEVLWLFRMNDEFNLLTLCFILIYTDQFGNNNLMVDSIFTLKTYSISSFTLVGRTGFVILTYM